MAYLRVPDFAIGNSSKGPFSVGGLPPPHTPPKSRPSASRGRTLPPTWVPGPQNLVWDYGLGAIWAQNGFWGN